MNRSWLRTLAAAVTCGFLITAGAATWAEEGDPERGEKLFGLCAQCHGANGEGNPLALAPSIAGLDAWYVEGQVKKFRSGIRGTHPDDVGGLRMYPMALHLDQDQDIADLSAYVASLPPVKPEPTVEGGVAANGAAAYALCASCHGTAGEGNPATQGPSLRNTSDWYLVDAIRKYKSGVRGSDPRDQYGAVMKGMVATLADDQAIKDVVAYIMSLEQSASN